MGPGAAIAPLHEVDLARPPTPRCSLTVQRASTWAARNIAWSFGRRRARQRSASSSPSMEAAVAGAVASAQRTDTVVTPGPYAVG